MITTQVGSEIKNEWSSTFIPHMGLHGVNRDIAILKETRGSFRKSPKSIYFREIQNVTII
jgi:hypothetical protein